MSRLIRRSLILFLAASMATLVSACAGAEDEPRPITTEESQILALTRFRNFEDGTRPFSTTLPVAGEELGIDGYVDFRNHVGYALVTATDAAPQLLWWTFNSIAIHPAPEGSTEEPVLPIPNDDGAGWNRRALDPSSSALDTLAVLLLQFANDRPENPLLLQQTGALWLGEDTVDRQPLTRYAAPPSEEPVSAGSVVDPDASALRMWIDELGRAHVIETRLGNDWITTQLGGSENFTLESPEGT